MVQTISPAAALRIRAIKTLACIPFGTHSKQDIFLFFTEEGHSSKVGEYGGVCCWQCFMKSFIRACYSFPLIHYNIFPLL